MERTTDYARCPVHNTLLEPDHYLGINVWHCAKCNTYYAKGKAGSMTSNITINGVPILFKEDLVTISKEVLVEQQKAAEERQFMEQYERLPESSELLICPIHQKMLLSKKATLTFDGIKVTTPIGYCCHCDTLYMNNLQTALLGDTIFLKKRVTWMPIRFKHREDASKSPNIKVNIKTNSIVIVLSKRDIRISPKFIAPAVAQITLQRGILANIDGYYVASTQQFYATAGALFSQILFEERKQLQIADPKNLLRKYIQPISQQKSIKNRRENDAKKQKALDKQKTANKALETLFYTQPLLKGDDKHCPFCHQELHHRRLNMVVYHNKIAASTLLAPCLFCERCQVPFISLTQEIRALNRLKPRMIYVFDAKTCANAQELLQRATQKYRKRPDTIKNVTQLPLEKELEEGRPLPNLSFELKTSRVLVYANNCHCTACHKKYQQNTIRNRAALVKTVEGKTVKINVEFCVGCGRYFINITSFQQYRRKYGPILLECEMDQELVNHNQVWFDFAPDTVLSRCGYSVKKGIPRTHREAVLAYILDSGKATKYEILEIISKFIRLRSGYLPEACERWRQDMEFVNQYKIQSQEVVEGLTFQKAGKYRP